MTQTKISMRQMERMIAFLRELNVHTGRVPEFDTQPVDPYGTPGHFNDQNSMFSGIP